MNIHSKKQVLLAIALVCIGLFGAGLGYWIVAGQHHRLCPDGRDPIAQQDQGLGQIVYRCHGGVVVTGSILP